MAKVTVLESRTERSFVKYVEGFSAHSLKVNRTGWPDRIVTVKYGYCFYIEFKRKGEAPRRLQRHVHGLIRLLGFHVYVCDNIEDAKMIFDYESHIAALYKSDAEKQPELDI